MWWIIIILLSLIIIALILSMCKVGSDADRQSERLIKRYEIPCSQCGSIIVIATSLEIIDQNKALCGTCATKYKQ